MRRGILTSTGARRARGLLRSSEAAGDQPASDGDALRLLAAPLETGSNVMTLNEHLDRLAAFERVTHPVVSLYLNTRPNERGRDHFQAFVRKELKARAATYAPRSPERESLERDLHRISHFLAADLQPLTDRV